MYLDFFRLQKMPFRLAPDPAFLYWSAGHTATLRRARSALGRPGGCLALLGSRGVGKSTVLEYLAREQGEHPPIRMAFPPPSLQALDGILAAAEEQPGQAPIVLCDNAHLFTPLLLSALLLRTLPRPGAQTLRVVLAGEPHLSAALADPAVLHVSGGLGEPCHLPPLRAEEVRAYIAHRLAIAGLPDSALFGDDICEEIHRETRGNPRLVNALCDAAMTLACEHEIPRIGVAEVMRGLQDIAALSLARDGNAPPEGHAPTDPGVPAPAQRDAVDEPAAALGSIQVIHAGRVLEERELTAGVLRVGRGPENDLRLEGKYISRNHCRVVTNSAMSLLQDVRSTNGLFVNDKRVRNHRLRDGDVVQLGEHELRYADYRSDKEGSD